MGIDEIKNYIFNLKRFNKQPKSVEIVKEVLSLLGFNLCFKVVHVAGTNGKGSTSTMINNALVNAGYKTGLFISPHLVKINERIKINNIDISDEDFVKYSEKIIDITKKQNIELIFFEFVTILCLIYFEAKKIDVAVLECGLGGTYDATNIFDKVDLSVITNIGLDHEDVLGEGIVNIAKAKAGIIKKYSLVVLYDIDNDEARQVFSDEVDKNNSLLYEVKWDDESLNAIKTNMQGIHQKKNALTAKCAIAVLNKIGYNISRKNFEDGLMNVNLQARFQILTKENEKPIIILDGGHNPQCIDAVCDELRNYDYIKNKVFVVSTVNNKDTDTIAEKLSKISKNFILCHINNNSRALDKDNLLKIFSKYSNNIEYKENVTDAINLAKEKAGKDGMVCIVGSLYLAGEVLKNI